MLRRKFIEKLIQDNHRRKYYICHNLINCSLFGNYVVSLVSQSILASSICMNEVQERLRLFCNSLHKDTSTTISVQRKNMGKVKYASLRRTYDCIPTGCDIPKYNYAFIIDAGKLQTALKFLQEYLQMNPGTLNNVKVGGNLFKCMYVYDCGGKSYDNLYKAYVNSHQENECVGRKTFIDFITLLTKRGETKAGLSTYYINFRYASKTFLQRMNRLKEITASDQSITNKIMDITNKWSDIEQFVAYEHSTHHLSLDTDDLSHCCRCALGGICQMIHSPKSCQQCSDVVSFFESEVENIIEKSLINVADNDDYNNEIQTMKKQPKRWIKN